MIFVLKIFWCSVIILYKPFQGKLTVFAEYKYILFINNIILFINNIILYINNIILYINNIKAWRPISYKSGLRFLSFYYVSIEIYMFSFLVFKWQINISYDLNKGFLNPWHSKHKFLSHLIQMFVLRQTKEYPNQPRQNKYL